MIYLISKVENSCKLGLVLSLILLGFCVNAQNLEELADHKPLHLTGRIHLGISTYNVNGIDSRRSPFSWRLSGNPTLTIYGLEVPIRLAAGDQKYSFDHPFSRYGVSPYYKWVKVHLGWSNLKFSPYTFGGRSFFGAGVELTPGKFKFASFYGKLEDLYAKVDTVVYGARRIQTFERKAYGMQIGFGDRSNYVRMSSVRATDELESVASHEELAKMGYYPQDNLIIGLSFGLQFFKSIRFNLETAASILTDNQNGEGLPITNNSFENFFSFLSPNRKTYISYAGDATLSYSRKKFSILAIYKRVEPRFQTLTTTYFNQDYENYRIQINFSIAKTLSVQLGGGLQRDNLYDLRKFTSKRLIGNVNLNYRPTEQWSFNLRHANFNREMSEDVAAVDDTLRRISVNQQSGLSIRYKSPMKESAFSIYSNIFHNTINDLSPGENNLGKIKNTTLMMGASFALFNPVLVVSPNINYTQYSLGSVVQERYGGGVGIRWKMNETLNLSIKGLYNRNDQNFKHNGYVLRNSLSASFKIGKSQSVQLRLSHIKRESLLRPSFSEFRTGLGYGLKF